MLKCRKIILNNDGTYEAIFGQGRLNFLYDAEALAQILTHQILTKKGELKTKINYGVDWFSNIDPINLKTIYDTQIKNILTSNIYVTAILSFNSEYNLQTNTYNAKIKVSTTEGMLQLNI